MIALGNRGSSFSFNPLAPSNTICTVLVVSGPKPRPGCLLPRPQSRCLSPPKRRPDLLVDRPVQFAVRITPQRVHHDHHHFFAVLALVPFFPAFLAPPGLSLRLASMPLATARAPLRMLTFPPPLAQLLFCRCRRALAVHLDYQYLAVIRRRPHRLHERRCLPAQTQHQVLDSLS